MKNWTLTAMQLGKKEGGGFRRNLVNILSFFIWHQLLTVAIHSGVFYSKLATLWLPFLLFPGRQSSQLDRDRWRKQCLISQFHLLPQSCLSLDQDGPRCSRRFCRRGNVHVLKCSQIPRTSLKTVVLVTGTVFYLVIHYWLNKSKFKGETAERCNYVEVNSWKRDLDLKLNSWLCFLIFEKIITQHWQPRGSDLQEVFHDQAKYRTIHANILSISSCRPRGTRSGLRATQTRVVVVSL